MKQLFVSGCVVALLCGAAYAHPDHPEGATRIAPAPNERLTETARPWTSLEALDADARFHFVVVTDRTGGERSGVFPAAMEQVNLMQPAFVVSVGDLIQGYTDDREQIEAEWDELDGFVERLDAPFFYTPGNHDYSNQAMADVWSDRYGPDYYSFTYKDVLFVVLNSGLFDRSDSQGHGSRRGEWADEQAAQLAWLETTLEEHTDVRWTFVMTHRPYWRRAWVRTEAAETPDTGPWPRHETVPAEWQRVEALLSQRNYTAFAGHMHTYEYDAEINADHTHERIALATTGGVSNLRGVEYGEFDHFVWVTMTEDGPVIANLLLDGILPKDFEQEFQRPWWAPRDPSDPERDSE
ncbi:metallophosphoesterase [Hyphomonadaceae bacterium BL14]|nr:metallophosphoesterase [Hyphomonadaceae bacterium BL14]